MSKENYSRRPLLSALSLFSFSLLGFFLFMLTCVATKAQAWHFFAVGIGALSICIGIATVSWSRNNKVTRVACILTFLGILPLFLLLPKSTKTFTDRPIESHFLDEASSPFFSGLPERELVRLGEMIGWKDQERQTLGEGGVWTNYSTIENEKAFATSHSYVLDSWFVDRGHYWIAPTNEKPKAILVFLHGNGGNFKAYPYWFHEMAQGYDILSIYPTWGLGIWPSEKLAERVTLILNKVKKEHDLSETPVYLCGLSAGAIATVNMIAKEEIAVDGFIALSGTPKGQLKSFGSLAKTPSLFIHGVKDTHLPVEPTHQLVTSLKEKKAKVTYIEYENADHTLLNQRPQEVVKAICQWIGEEVKCRDR